MKDLTRSLAIRTIFLRESWKFQVVSLFIAVYLGSFSCRGSNGTSAAWSAVICVSSRDMVKALAFKHGKCELTSEIPSGATKLNIQEENSLINILSFLLYILVEAF